MKRNMIAYIWPCGFMALGLYCVLSPSLAKDIASAQVMMSGQPEHYHDWPNIDAMLHVIGAVLIAVGAIILLAIRQSRK